ncbi:MAG: TrkH family potassium uptake protein [Christensenellales bacterium]
MNCALVITLLGRLMSLEAAMMLPALGVSLWYGQGDAPAFLYAMGILLLLGLPMMLLIKPTDKTLRPREGFVVVGLAWILFSAFGALPFMFSGATVFFWDAFFETVSGFTTTGATIFAQVETLPRGILFWRSFTHWVGGMGVLILTLAVMPKMGARSAHLARAESPGPTFSKMLPRMAGSARILYLIYLVMTLILIVLLVISGMPLFDSVIHAFGTAGTGGFSSRNLSVGAYNNLTAEIIITVFMLLFGTNFIVYFRLIQGEGLKALRNEEVRLYYGVAISSIVLITINTIPHYGGVGMALRHASFQVSSIMSTTGYSTSDFDLWPQFSRILLLTLMFMGSCAGSTAGGIKVVRVALLGKLGIREVGRTVQPRRVRLIKLDQETVDENTLRSVLVFFVLYMAMLLAGTLLVSLDGVDHTTSFSAAAACLSNVGPGLALVGPMANYSHFSFGIKYLLSFLMLLGRLEFIPMLVLFSPAVWRRGR